MAYKFNPFTGNFDYYETGGGGGGVEITHVATYADLPLASEHSGEYYYVDSRTGFLNPFTATRNAGLYRSTGTAWINDISQGVWGTITGTLSDQTDLSTALGTKVDKETGSRLITSAESTLLGNTSGTNTGDDATNSQYSSLVSNATHSGDVTGATELTIANNAVTNAKSAQMGANTYKGNATGSTADASDNATNTAFNKNYSTTATDIKMAGTQSLGSADTLPRADHVHPTDTSCASISSNNDFTGQNTFTSSSYPVTNTTRNTAATNSSIATGMLRTVCSGDMTDGFGCHFDYAIRDTANTDNVIARIGAVRNGADNSGAVIFHTSSAGTLSEKWRISSAGQLIPSADNTYTLGGSGARPSQLWAATATINTSDERQKENIVPLADDSRMDILFDNLTPVSYKWKDYTDKITVYKTDKNGNEHTEVENNIHTFKRLHHGMIAQEVESAMNAASITSDEFAGLIKDEPTGEYGLRYEEFIPMLIKQVQDLKKEIAILRKQNEG